MARAAASDMISWNCGFLHSSTVWLNEKIYWFVGPATWNLTHWNEIFGAACHPRNYDSRHMVYTMRLTSSDILKLWILSFIKCLTCIYICKKTYWFVSPVVWNLNRWNEIFGTTRHPRNCDSRHIVYIMCVIASEMISWKFGLLHSSTVWLIHKFVRKPTGSWILFRET